MPCYELSEPLPVHLYKKLLYSGATNKKLFCENNLEIGISKYVLGMSESLPLSIGQKIGKSAFWAGYFG